MNTKIVVLIGLLFLSITSFSQKKISPDFSKKLEASGMTFEKQKGFVETEPLVNKFMAFQYALKSESDSSIMCYAIRDIKTKLKEYEESKQKGEEANDPNRMAGNILMYMASMVADGQSPQNAPKIFEADAVKKEFNADWGAAVLVAAGHEFTQGKYKYCLVVGIHKQDIADAFCFYFSNTTDFSTKGSLIHALKFK